MPFGSFHSRSSISGVPVPAAYGASLAAPCDGVSENTRSNANQRRYITWMERKRGVGTQQMNDSNGRKMGQSCPRSATSRLSFPLWFASGYGRPGIAPNQ